MCAWHSQNPIGESPAQTLKGKWIMGNGKMNYNRVEKQFNPQHVGVGL